MSKRAEPYAGIFAHIDFPDYKYKEYPKYVIRPNDKKKLIVASHAEELAFLQELPEGAEMPPDPVVRERDDLAAKLAIMQQEMNALKLKMAETAQPQAPPPMPPPEQKSPVKQGALSK